MRWNKGRPQRKAQAPRRPAERPRPGSAGPEAGESDLAALGEAGPSQRQHGAGWFEQIKPDLAPAAGGQPQPAPLVHAPRRTPRAWLSALAVTLAAGMVLGFAVGSVRSGEPTSAPATRAPATQPTQAPQTSVVVRPAASPACLETAMRGDQLIDLLITNQRSRAADLLVAYTVASRQCRKDASP